MPRDESESRRQYQDIFANYLTYTQGAEPPTHYHRWCWLGSLGAVIGRKAYISNGPFRIFPTLYIQLLGEPGARKSTAIKMCKQLISASGYSSFAADKTSKEKFLLDLEGIEPELQDDPKNKRGEKGYDAVTAENLWGSNSVDSEPREVFIVADEFNEFAGSGNLEFYTTLGNLWDHDSPEQPFTQRLKNSRSISIYQPTISILSGNTPELFARCFPPEAIGSGFLSRLLLVHGEKTDRRVTWIPEPDLSLKASLTSYLMRLRSHEPGRLTPDSSAYSLIDKIYQQETPVEDIRFKGYMNRRHTQLLRICVILATAKFKKEITEEDVIQANTILTHAEILMPKAMGEFGKSKFSDVANRIISYLEGVTRPVTMKEIWKQVSRDLPGQKELVDIMQGLAQAERVQTITGVMSGYLLKKEARRESKFVDWSFLTQEELDMI